MRNIRLESYYSQLLGPVSITHGNHTEVSGMCPVSKTTHVRKCLQDWAHSTLTSLLLGKVLSWFNWHCSIDIHGLFVFPR